ncbi:unnamed protein product [Gadus morhua 'NCC']
MYCDPINKLYLQFLMPILQEFSRVKKRFQLEIGYAFKMLDCLKTCFRSLVPNILTPNAIPPSDLRLIDVNLDDTRNHMPLSVVTFGVQNRLPGNMNLWRSMAVFSPSVMLSQSKPPLSTVTVLKLYAGDLGKLDTQYQAVHFHEWDIEGITKRKSSGPTS